MQSITGMSSPIHLLDWLANRNKYCSFLATISYHLAYWSSTLIVSWKSQWLDWMKFHRMLMRITLPNELCTVLESTLLKGYIFFITSKLAWNSFSSNTFSEYLGVSNQSNIDTLLANQRYVIMHNILLYWYLVFSPRIWYGAVTLI